MKHVLHRCMCWAWALTLVVSTSACGTLFHSAKEIHGQVVDAETGKPLEGAIIVVQWQPYFVRAVAHAPGHSGSIHTYEALTDKEGRYAIPAWGPKPVPVGGANRTPRSSV